MPYTWALEKSVFNIGLPTAVGVDQIYLAQEQ